MNRFSAIDCGKEYVEDVVDDQWVGFAKNLIGPVVLLLCVIIVVVRVFVLSSSNKIFSEHPFERYVLLLWLFLYDDDNRAWIFWSSTFYANGSYGGY